MSYVYYQLILALMIAGTAHAQNQAAIVYSSATSRVRRIIVPDKDADLGSVKVAAGEAVMLVDRTTMNLPADAQQAVTAKTGQTPANDRYVIVPTGKGVQPVLGVVIADPTCGDAVAGSELIQHGTADTTWTYDRSTGTFSAPAVTVVTPKGQ